MKMIFKATLLYALTTAFASAALITFDDLPAAQLGGTVVPNGYRELNWSNMFYLNASNNNLGPPSGYMNARKSFPHVAFMGDDSIGKSVVVSGPVFDFNSAWLTAAWNNGLNVRVQGYSGGINGTLLYDRTVTVNTSGPTFFTFNYLGIDTLRFDPSGGTPAFGGSGARHLVFDDMTITRRGEPTAENVPVVAGASDSSTATITPIVLKGSDPKGLPLTFTVLSSPLHGDLGGTGPNLTYLPRPNYLGTDVFRYVVSNGTFTSDPATVSITVKHALFINNISLTEGNSGTKAAIFTVTMTVPGSDLNLVTVGYQTADGTAKAGSDYVATSSITSGPLIFGENTAQTIAVRVIGDTSVEQNETFLASLFNASANAVIVNGIGRCTIKNDDFLVLSRIGTAALTPENSVVDVGEPVNLSLAWTHPVGWRQLDSIDLLLVDDEGESLVVRWHEAGNSFSLFNPAADRFTRTAEAGSPARFETSAVRLDLQESTGGGPPGQTVAIEYSLSFKPHTAGRTFSVEALATDDAGNQQGFESVGTITVLPRSHDE
jgi:hypothetical protein